MSLQTVESTEVDSAALFVEQVGPSAATVLLQANGVTLSPEMTARPGRINPSRLSVAFVPPRRTWTVYAAVWVEHNGRTIAHASWLPMARRAYKPRSEADSAYDVGGVGFVAKFHNLPQNSVVVLKAKVGLATYSWVVSTTDSFSGDAQGRIGFVDKDIHGRMSKVEVTAFDDLRPDESVFTLEANGFELRSSAGIEEPAAALAAAMRRLHPYKEFSLECRNGRGEATRVTRATGLPLERCPMLGAWREEDSDAALEGAREVFVSNLPLQCLPEGYTATREDDLRGFLSGAMAAMRQAVAAARTLVAAQEKVGSAWYQEKFERADVQTVCYNVRFRDADANLPSPAAALAPMPLAHVDSTKLSNVFSSLAGREVLDRLQELGAKQADDEHAFVERALLGYNVWVPVGEVEDFPLAFLDASRVRADALREVQLQKTGREQLVSHGLYYDERQQWHYRPFKNQSHEAYYFVTAQDSTHGRSAAPHSAVALLRAPGSAPAKPRRSVELRCMVLPKAVAE